MYVLNDCDSLIESIFVKNSNLNIFKLAGLVELDEISDLIVNFTDISIIDSNYEISTELLAFNYLFDECKVYFNFKNILFSNLSFTGNV